MKIATWNVNGIRASFDQGLKDFVEKQQPDILCLQETKAHKDQLKPEVKNLGSYPFQCWSSCGIKKGYSGTATLSHIPFLKTSGLGIKKYDWEGRVIVSEFDSFILMNIYFPNGALTTQRHLFKQEFLKRLVLFLKQLKKETQKELMIVGDYNVAYLEKDVHSPKTLQKTSGFLEEERQWFLDFLKEGYLDVFREFYPAKEEAYTWWSHRENARRKNKGWRIDHICITEGLRSKIKGIQIHQEQLGSDHCPIVVELKK
ncbi:MAG: exodeoxyribonuclease III [Bdellovibrionales bacterium]